MTPEEVLTAYAAAYDLAGCAYNQDGLCRLRIDNDLHIDLEIQPDAHSVLMQSAIAGVDMDNPALLAEILSSNLHYNAPGHPVVALDRYASELVLIRYLAPEQSLESFAAALDDFAIEIDGWHEFLHTPGAWESEEEALEAPEGYRGAPMNFA